MPARVLEKFSIIMLALFTYQELASEAFLRPVGTLQEQQEATGGLQVTYSSLQDYGLITYFNGILGNHREEGIMQKPLYLESRFPHIGFLISGSQSQHGHDFFSYPKPR